MAHELPTPIHQRWEIVFMRSTPLVPEGARWIIKRDYPHEVLKSQPKKDELRVSIHIQLRSAAGIRLCCDFLPEACWRKNNVSFSAGWELSE